MNLKELLIGEYSGTIAPLIDGRTQIIRNRTRVFETEKGHLSYSMVELITDQRRRVSRKSSFIGFVVANEPENGAAGGTVPLHLSPLDRPYRPAGGVRCEFGYRENLESFFLTLRWREGGSDILFPLKKCPRPAVGVASP
jgi:hypothetical protein